MIFAILAGMAAQERVTIMERTMGGRKEKAQKGGFAGGRAPYGYKHDQERNLVVVPEQAAVVQRIFAERAAGLTLVAISDGLNEDGILSPNGVKWNHSGVAYLLDNPKYRGNVEYLFQFGGSVQHVLRAGVHDAIVQAEEPAPAPMPIAAPREPRVVKPISRRQAHLKRLAKVQERSAPTIMAAE